MNKKYEERPSKRWTAETDQLLEESIMNVFSQHFQQSFGTYKELIEFYRTKEPNELGSCWAEIGKRVNTTREVACKRFLNSHVKRYLQTWPPELVEKVLADAIELTKKQSRLDLNMERALVIQQVEVKYGLKQMTQYHYPQLYNQMYNKIKQVQAQFLHDDDSIQHIIGERSRPHGQNAAVTTPQAPQVQIVAPQNSWVTAQIINHNRIATEINPATDSEHHTDSMLSAGDDAQDALYKMALAQLNGLQLALPHLSQDQQSILAKIMRVILQTMARK